jgi:hypothetical protein
MPWAWHIQCFRAAQVTGDALQVHLVTTHQLATCPVIISVSCVCPLDALPQVQLFPLLQDAPILRHSSLLLPPAAFSLSPHPRYREMTTHDPKPMHDELKSLVEEYRYFKIKAHQDSYDDGRRVWSESSMLRGYLYLAEDSLQKLQSRRLEALQSAGFQAALPKDPRIKWEYGTTHGDQPAVQELRNYMEQGEKLFLTEGPGSAEHSLFNGEKSMQALVSALQRKGAVSKDALSRAVQWMCESPSSRNRFSDLLQWLSMNSIPIP